MSHHHYQLAMNVRIFRDDGSHLRRRQVEARVAVVVAQVGSSKVAEQQHGRFEGVSHNGKVQWCATVSVSCRNSGVSVEQQVDNVSVVHHCGNVHRRVAVTVDAVDRGAVSGEQ